MKFKHYDHAPPCVSRPLHGLLLVLWFSESGFMAAALRIKWFGSPGCHVLSSEGPGLRPRPGRPTARSVAGNSWPRIAHRRGKRPGPSVHNLNNNLRCSFSEKNNRVQDTSLQFHILTRKPKKANTVRNVGELMSVCEECSLNLIKRPIETRYNTFVHWGK